MRKLKTIEINGKTYFIDRRLSQIRNVKNPHDYEGVSPELIEYWAAHNIKKL